MPETDVDREKRLLKELEGKNIAWYQVLLSTWIKNRIEHDKTLITLSVAAIGLLITILTTIGAKHLLQMILVGFAFTGFIGTVIVCLGIFKLNDRLLEDTLKGGDGKSLELEKNDKMVGRLFTAGLICAVLFGLVTAIINGGSMAEEKSKETGSKQSQKQKLTESLNGIQNLAPEKLETGKSLSGIGNLSPQNLQSNIADTSGDTNPQPKVQNTDKIDEKKGVE